MPLYHTRHWSIELPAGWQAEQLEESVLLRREGGHGTLSITLLREREPVTGPLLRELAASTLAEGHPPEACAWHGGDGLCFSYQEEGSAWREWYLAAGRSLFFISYDAPPDEAAHEMPEVEAMVAHLTLRA